MTRLDGGNESPFTTTGGLPSPGFTKFWAVLIPLIGLVLATLLPTSRFAGDALVYSSVLAGFNCSVLFQSRGERSVLLLPSTVVANYLLLSLSMGALAFEVGAVVLPAMKVGPQFWGDPIEVRAFVVGSFALLSLFADYRPFAAAEFPTHGGEGRFWGSAFAAILISLVAERLGFAFSGEVGAGLFGVVVLYGCRVPKAYVRWAVYFAVIVAYALIFAQSKRNAVFLLYPVLLVEAVRLRRRVDWRDAFRATLLALAVAALVVLATAWRIREVLGLTSVLEVPAAALGYIQGEQFLGYFLLNLEVTYTYFHFTNCVEMVRSGELPVLWGQTYIKPLFIGISESLVAWRPVTAVHAYTYVYDPVFRAIGGSWVVSMLGEAYLNFRSLGILVPATLLLFADRLVKRFAARLPNLGGVAFVTAVYVPVASLVFARGSGLDLMLVQAVVVALVGVVACIAFGCWRPFDVRVPSERTAG